VQRESLRGATYAAQRPLPSLSEHLFNLADFLLDFASDFFVLAFGHQVWIVRDLSRFLFRFALHFMNAAFDLVRRAQFHLVLLVVLCPPPSGHRAIDYRRKSTSWAVSLEALCEAIGRF
jgi:hypothetical protein